MIRKNRLTSLLLTCALVVCLPLLGVSPASPARSRLDPLAAEPLAVISSVTVASIQIENWRYGGATGKLRVYASETFDQTGTFVIGSSLGSGQWHKQIDCTVAATTITVPAFSLPVTTTSSVPSASYTFVWVDSKGTERDVYLSEIKVPDTLGATVTWSQLNTYNATRRLPNNPTYPTTDQVTSLIGEQNWVTAGRVITATSPLRIDGGASADLNANRTLSCPTCVTLTIAGDGIIGTTGNTTSGSSLFNDASAAFVAGDVGKKIVIETTTMPRATAGFIGSITQVNSPTQVVLSGNASATWANTRYTYGTDKTTELAAALSALPANGGKITVSGILMISSTLSITKPVVFEGQGGVNPKYYLAAPTEAAPSDVFDFSLSYGTKLMWAGGASNFVNITNTAGVYMTNVLFDGAGVALIGMNLDRVRHSTFRRAHSMRSVTALFVGSTASANDGSFENTFDSCFYLGTNGIVINGSGAGTTGGFLNNFHSIQIEFLTVGVDFQKGDNNSFTGHSFIWNHQYLNGGAGTNLGTNVGINFGTGPFGAAHASPLNPYSCYNQYIEQLLVQGIVVAAGNREAGRILNLDEGNVAGGVAITYGAGSGLDYKTMLSPAAITAVNQFNGTLIYRYGGLSEPLFYISSSGTLDPRNGPNQYVTGNRTLPATTGWPGFVLNLVNTNAGASVIAPSAGDTISEQASYTLTAKWKCVTVKSDATFQVWVVTGTCN